MKKIYNLILFCFVLVLMSFNTKYLDKEPIDKMVTFENNCNKTIKNSSFIYRYDKEDVLVVFRDKFHMEYHNDKKHFIKSEIEWISDCEYNLTIKENNLPNFPFSIGTTLKIVVTRISGKKVYYTSTLGGRSWKGIMTKTSSD